MTTITIQDAIELLKKVQEYEEKMPLLQKYEDQAKRKKVKHREYMPQYYATHPDQYLKNLARARKMTVEEYVAKKEAGIIKMGRPRKTVPVETVESA